MQKLDTIIAEVVKAILEDKPLPEEKCRWCKRTLIDGDCDYCEQMKQDCEWDLRLQKEKKDREEQGEEYYDDED